MEFITLTTLHPDFDFTFSLWQEAFPPEERRPDDMQCAESNYNSLFKNCLIRCNGQNVGMITYWQFEHFRYVEHFAISSTVRNEGYGGKAIEVFYALALLPLVLEVERPDTVDAARRITFYQRHQFMLWEHDYVQPAYASSYPQIPMYLMVRGNLSPQTDFESIKSQLYREVYRCL